MAGFKAAKQTKIKTRVEGIQEVLDTFKNMGDLAADVLEKAALAGGEIALEYSKQNCPTNTGALKNSLHLEKSKVKKPNIKAEYKVQPGKKEYYGTFVELGTSKMSAKPYLRPAVDNNKDKIQKEITSVIDKAIGRCN